MTSDWGFWERSADHVARARAHQALGQLEHAEPGVHEIGAAREDLARDVEDLLEVELLAGVGDVDGALGGPAIHSILNGREIGRSIQERAVGLADDQHGVVEALARGLVELDDHGVVGADSR